MPKVEDGKLSDFRPQENNANAHTERGLKALSNAYGEVGYVAPMTAAANGEVLDGNARLEQAFDQFKDEALVIHHSGDRPIIMIRDDVPDADDPRAKKISYGANRIGEIDLKWDPEQLLIDKEAGVDFSGLFFENEFDEIIADVKKEPPEESPPPVDKAAELQEKWGVNEGDIWQIESATNPGKYHRLICSDCRDMEMVKRLTEGRKVNGAFTSPPYAMQRVKQYGGVEADKYVDWWEAVQENVRAALAEDGSFFVNIKPHCKDGQRVLYVFDLVTTMVRRWGWWFVDELYWKRQGYPGDYKGRFKNEIEPVFHFTTGKHKHSPGNVLSDFSDNSGGIDRLKNYQESAKQKLLTDSPFTKAGPGLGFARYGKDGALPGNIIQANTGAAAQQTGAYQAATFPIKLPTFFIKAYSDKTDIWLDPFAGSGTVGCAAENEGRLSMMVEKLPKYCSVILQRMKDIGLEPILVENINA